MKIKINGSVSKEALESILTKQNEKKKVIDEFVKVNKINDFSYSDSEMEYEVAKLRIAKVEVRGNGQNQD